MPDMTNSAFIGTVSHLRRDNSLDEFKSTVSSIKQFIALIDIIETKTIKWGKDSGLIGDKEGVNTDKLTPQEILWANFFRDHSFPDAEEQRNFTDALTILTGIDMLRFIRVIKPRKDRYPAYIVIVPTGSINGHNYRIGEPVLSLTSGITFYKKNGDTGNNMTTDIKEVRMPTREEIENIVLCVMFKLGVSTEHLVSNLLNNED